MWAAIWGTLAVLGLGGFGAGVRALWKRRSDASGRKRFANTRLVYRYASLLWAASIKKLFRKSFLKIYPDAEAEFQRLVTVVEEQHKRELGLCSPRGASRPKPSKSATADTPLPVVDRPAS